MWNLGGRHWKGSVKARGTKGGRVGFIRVGTQSCLGYFKAEMVMKYTFPGVCG